MTNIDSILKSWGVTLLTKVCIVKAVVFTVVMYGYESWTIKKGERWKNQCFWTVVLEKILESPLDCKEIQSVHPKGNQSWIFIGRTWCWSWNSNSLATWCEELTHWKRPWCWERLKAGGEGDDRGRDGSMASLTQCAWVWVNSGSWWWTGMPGVLQSMGSQRVRLDWVTELKCWHLAFLSLFDCLFSLVLPLFLPTFLLRYGSWTFFFIFLKASLDRILLATVLPVFVFVRVLKESAVDRGLCLLCSEWTRHSERHPL